MTVNDFVKTLDSFLDGRYKIVVTQGEYAIIYDVVDTIQPEREQPCIVHSFSTRDEPNAAFLANDFCRRHNK